MPKPKTPRKFTITPPEPDRARIVADAALAGLSATQWICRQCDVTEPADNGGHRDGAGRKPRITNNQTQQEQSQ